MRRRQKKGDEPPAERAVHEGECVRPRPFLSIAQLAQVTPWTEPAIRAMIARGTFRLGEHYFQPTGRGGQIVFSWAAVVAFVQEASVDDSGAGSNLPDRLKVDWDEFKAKAKALLD